MCPNRLFNLRHYLYDNAKINSIATLFRVVSDVGLGYTLLRQAFSGHPSSCEILEAYVIVPERGPADPNRFALIPVRPDWIDNQSVLGFVNPITNNYESTASLDLIMRADQALKANNGSASTDRYFMLLDEMNLAKVEHYFSDWLACTESRRIEPDNSIRQQTVPLHRGLEMKAALFVLYAGCSGQRRIAATA